jgi:hypothetical protein
VRAIAISSLFTIAAGPILAQRLASGTKTYSSAADVAALLVKTACPIPREFRIRNLHRSGRPLRARRGAAVRSQACRGVAASDRDA